MPDATEPYRRQRLVEINTQPGSREALEAQHQNLQTTSRYSQRNEEQLAEGVERLRY